MPNPSPHFSPGSPSGKRARRTEASRERILGAAVEVLIEAGYSGASTLEIQRRARVSRGRLTHHFPSRDGLLVSAAAHLARTRLEGLLLPGELPAEIGVLAKASDPARVEQAVTYLWFTFHQSYFWAAAELWVASRHRAELAEALLPEERNLYVTIRRVVDEAFGETFTRRKGYRACREILFTSMRGVAFTYSFAPRDFAQDPHLELWKDTARRLLELKPVSKARK